MTDREHGSRAAGSLLAFSIIAGAVAGAILREPSIGFLAGTGVGLLILGLFWLSDRRRRSGETSGDAAARPDDAADHVD